MRPTSGFAPIPAHAYDGLTMAPYEDPASGTW